MTWQGQYWKQDEQLSHMKLYLKLKMVLMAQNKSWYGEVYVVYPLIEYLFKIVNNMFEWRQRNTALPKYLSQLRFRTPSNFILSLTQQHQKNSKLLQTSHCQYSKFFNVNYCTNLSKTECSFLQFDNMYTRGLSKAVNMHCSDSSPSDWRDTGPFRSLSTRFSPRE